MPDEETYDSVDDLEPDEVPEEPDGDDTIPDEDRDSPPE